MVISLSGVPIEKIKQEERLKRREKLKSGTGNRDEKEKGSRRNGGTGRRKKTVNKENVLKLTKWIYCRKKILKKKYRKEVRKHMKGIGPVFLQIQEFLVII